MVLDKIPHIFFNAWLWIGIAVVLIAIRYLFGKTPPPYKPSDFILKHKNTIRRFSDWLLMLILALDWSFIIYMSIKSIMLFYKALPAIDTIRHGLSVFLIMSLQSSAFTAIFIGILSIFYSNLTTFKRLFLLIISLIPIVLTILLILVTSPLKPEEFWNYVKLGSYSFITCCICNGPAIVAGKHFLYVAWYIQRALHLTSGEKPDWM